MAVIAVGGVINLLKHAVPRYVISMNSPAFVKFRKHFTIPATFGFKHSIPMSFLKIVSMATPTRGQSWVLFGYFALNIILLMVKYDLYLPNYYWSTRQLQLLRYLADRSGIMSFAHFPALFLFASRNNMMMYVTGWSFDTFNVYHRWIARIMVLHAFIHSVAYSISESIYMEYAESFEDTYWRWGVVATILCCLIIFQSIHFLRSRWYEAFLVIHITLAALFIAACWWHVITLGWHQWVWVSVGIWGFDRAVRVIRLAWNGIGYAETKLYANDIFKMTISTSGRWKYYPGCHIYVHVLKPWGFWESHPFTLYQHPDPAQKDKLIICGTAKEGMTRRVANDLSKLPDISYRLLIDGPYGARHNIQHYDSLIFIAGGIGITATYAYASDLISRSGMKQNITFIWITRQDSALKWFSEELNYLSSSERCALEVFITQTGESPSGSDTEYSKEKTSDSESLPNGQLKITRGVRPDVYELLTNHISSCEGSTGVVVCGPPTLNDTLRRCVADKLDTGKGRVDYLEEAFSW